MHLCLTISPPMLSANAANVANGAREKKDFATHPARSNAKPMLGGGNEREPRERVWARTNAQLGQQRPTWYPRATLVSSQHGIWNATCAVSRRLPLGYWDILRSWRASAGTGTTSEQSPPPRQANRNPCSLAKPRGGEEEDRKVAMTDVGEN